MFTTDGVYATRVIKTYRKRKYGSVFLAAFFQFIGRNSNTGLQVSKLIPLVYLAQANTSKQNTIERWTRISAQPNVPVCFFF